MTGPAGDSPLPHRRDGDHPAALVVVARFRLRPGSRARALELASSMARATLRDPGCLEVGFAEPVGETDALSSTESWASEAQFLAHLGQPHTREFLEGLGPLLAEPGVVRRYDVAAVQRLG